MYRTEVPTLPAVIRAGKFLPGTVSSWSLRLLLGLACLGFWAPQGGNIGTALADEPREELTDVAKSGSPSDESTVTGSFQDGELQEPIEAEVSSRSSAALESPRNQSDPDWVTLEHARARNPGGNHRMAAVNAYLLGRDAWDQGDSESARAYWKRAAAFDLTFLSPRLRLVQANLFRDFGATVEAVRQCIEIVKQDFHSQRWILSNALVGLCLAMTVSCLGLAVGLLIRHARALHHTVLETLSYTLRIGAVPAAILAVGFLLVPLAANLGILVTALFLLFVPSYRFARGERILALVAASWTIIVGPLLLVTSPWWSIPPDGRDAVLISGAQQDPTSPAYRGRVQNWIGDGYTGVALYLEGLASKVDGETDRALSYYERAKPAGDIPRWLIETNIGNALVQDDRTQEAERQYHHAIELEANAFEPHYNLALAQAKTGRYLQADAEFERASRIDLDRTRELSRTGDRYQHSMPIDALWATPDLWGWTLRNPGPELAPEPIAIFLPMRSLLWSAPIALLAVIAGFGAGRWLSRLIRVHQCYQCGSPVCRRCLVRLERRAYCHRCAEALGGMSSGEATRLLLKKLLDERPAWTSQIGQLLALAVPGLGPLLFGGPTLAFVTCTLAGTGFAMLLFPFWGHSLFWAPWPDPLIGVLQMSGLALLLVSTLLGVAGVRRERRRSTTVRAFLNRDVDRLAA